MLKSLYKNYFQKSKAFLYPLLGIRKSSLNVQPDETFISWKGRYKATDRRLICFYKNTETKQFEQFEKKLLLTNALFEHKFKHNNGTVYVFNLSIFKKDWEFFLKGQYSEFSDTVKKVLKRYYGEESAEYEHMESYLFPMNFLSVYSNLLDVPVSLLKEVGQFADKYDPTKEELNLLEEPLEV